MRIEMFELSEKATAAGCQRAVASPWVKVEQLFCRLEEAGVEIRRYGIDWDSLVFAAHAGVAELLRTEGSDALPAIFIGGKLVGQGRSLQVAVLKNAVVVRGVRL